MQQTHMLMLELLLSVLPEAVTRLFTIIIIYL